MIKLRKSRERGHANLGWLDSYHSFSFSSYYDPAYMGYSVLRVINEDVIEPGRGFGMHSHRDMEIITYMLQGDLRHEDSLGNGSTIHAGDVQRMTAGSGISHSEFNASQTAQAHLLQIWLMPEQDDLSPGYEEKHFPLAAKHNRWCLIASREGRDNSLKINQFVDLYASVLDQGVTLDMPLDSGRSYYLQVAQGNLQANGQDLQQGDAIRMDGETRLDLRALTQAEVLLFDLPPHHIPATQPI
ncbi:pirin family protein [Methylovorus sp. MP688]|uniref:pirin family protein n=1 Tax=Methylovorus sp. (strain MP688) TaxID=887061 RepID=UPI0001EC4593|nr:pirin family protein [Methylovorus sp. MP688]ADQ84186.1 Pirin domain protein [Methylovorus sp. MP688]